jgi:hypothetical protein
LFEYSPFWFKVLTMSAPVSIYFSNDSFHI